MAFADKQLDKLRDAILQHQGSVEATTCETLRSFLAESGLADTGDYIRQQAVTLVPKSLHGEHVNMHDAALVWRQVLAAYGHLMEAGNDNIPASEEAWERFRERVNEPRAVAHFIFPEEN